ncbi:hypothetical protein [Pseudomonas sp. W15Feb9B]|uniref:hypothetical protein n=1 Tax=Pseudomonas sp. W15Feb9B TaxID=550743 RepID=UPI000596EB49|nr:hypothetical protein [Pseudomonas sp. W15Feb9B]KIK83090.1 hypothetical protein OC71_25215 [Pseudomonas sp. W15Feb9B]
MIGRRSIEADFNTLIDLMADMIDAQVDLARTEGDEWIADLQTLSVKLFKQLCSARSLLEPTAFINRREQVFQFIDHSAVIVVIRACVESYIAMNWIFGSVDVDHRRFRHRIWILAGLNDRLGLHPTTVEGRQRVAETQTQADELILVVQASPFFHCDYTEKQRKRVLKGEWRVDWSWTDQAVRAGFHKKYFESMYSHYCGYAHSSYISAIQVRDSSSSIDDQYMLAQAALQAGVHVLAHFLFFYASILDAPNQVFESSEDARAVASIWHFAAGEMDHLYEQEKGADPLGRAPWMERNS